MDFTDVRTRLEADVYKVMVLYPAPEGSTRQEITDCRNVYRSARTKKTKQFSQDLQNCFISKGVPESIAIPLVSKAWEDGHASGLYEVINQAEELVPIIDALVNFLKNK